MRSGIALVTLLVSAAPSWAALKVGTFAAEVRHVYGVAQGLPSEDVRCVAVVSGRAWAGTAKGLAVQNGGSWKVVDQRPVSACASAGESLVAASEGAVLRVTGDGAPTVIGRSRGKIYAIAAGPGGKVLVGGDEGLFDSAGTRILSSPVYAVAVSSTGETAAGGAAGLFVAGKPVYPRAGNRSWAPADVRGVAFTHFLKEDVVRHPLVARIVDAYEKHSQRNQQQQTQQ